MSRWLVSAKVIYANLDDKKNYILEKLQNYKINPTSEGYKNIIIKNLNAAKNEEEFITCVNKIISVLPADLSYSLLKDNIITKNNKDIFDRLVNHILDKSVNKDINGKKYTDNYAYNLIKDGVVKKEDGEIFEDIIHQVILDSKYDLSACFYLLLNKYITRDMKDFFDDAVNAIIKAKNVDYLYKLLTNKILVQEDGDIFTNAVNTFLSVAPFESSMNLFYKGILDKNLIKDRLSISKDHSVKTDYNFLKYKIITKEDGKIFDQLIWNVIEGGDYRYCVDLIQRNILTEDHKYYNDAMDRISNASNE